MLWSPKEVQICNVSNLFKHEATGQGHCQRFNRTPNPNMESCSINLLHAASQQQCINMFLATPAHKHKPSVTWLMGSNRHLSATWRA
jgi:hypothetical protein